MHLVKDLSIYGDEFEEFIFELSKQLQFSDEDFFKLFDEKGFYSPSEFYSKLSDIVKLPKIFYIDLGKLLKGKIEYVDIDKKNEKKGKDITVGELVQLLKELRDLQEKTG